MWELHKSSAPVSPLRAGLQDVILCNFLKWGFDFHSDSWALSCHLCGDQGENAASVFSSLWRVKCSTADVGGKALWRETRGCCCWSGSAALEFQFAAEQTAFLPACVVQNWEKSWSWLLCWVRCWHTRVCSRAAFLCVGWDPSLWGKLTVPWGQTDERFIDLKVRKPWTFFLLERVQWQAKQSRKGAVMQSCLCPTTVVVLH